MLLRPVQKTKMNLGEFNNVGASFRGCGESKLRIDEACLEVVTKEDVTFWSQYDKCQDCMLLEKATINASGSFLILETGTLTRYAVKNGNGQICSGKYHFGEFGQYLLNVSEVTQDECLPRMTAEPDATYLPILTAVVVLLSMATLWYIVKGIGKRMAAGRWAASYFNWEDNELGSETRVLTSEVTVPRAPSRSRLRSLDTFRGGCIALMVFVNSGGGGYDIFQHGAWTGLTFADLVMPGFAFAMGEALVLSLNARLRTSLPRTTAFYQIARRSLLLSLIGICLDNSNNVSWSEARLPGVLQFLAATYLIVGTTECIFMTTNQGIQQGHSLIRDIAAGWRQWIVTLVLVTIKVCVTLLVAAPGCPKGYVGPGGLHMTALNVTNLQNCTGGIAGYIERTVIGPSHLSGYHRLQKVYHTALPYDPEGPLCVLTGLLVVQAGAHAMRIMLAYNHARARIMRWVFWSVVFGVTGGALCNFSASGGVIPINKHLWSLSFCLVTSSLALFLQAVLYFIIDLKNKWGGRPFYYAGQNSLFLYVCSRIFEKYFPFHIKIKNPTHAELLAANTYTTLIWMVVGVVLYKKRVFITL